MRLLRVIPSINPKMGGPVEGSRRIDELLIQRGHTVDVVCLDNQDARLSALRPGKTFMLGSKSGKYRYSTALVPWLKSNSTNYDAIIVNGIWQYHSYATWKAVRSEKVPYFVFTHGMLDPWFKQAYPLKHLKKWLYWPWADYRVLRDARFVLFTTEEERIQARRSFWLYKCNERVTAYGTSAPPADVGLSASFLAKHPEVKGKRSLLFLSRLHEKKGIDLLLEAFAHLAQQSDNVHLIIAGPDENGWQQKLQAMATKLGISDRITWPGMLEGDAKWGAFYACDAFCLPSHQENFGIVVAEALACGKPVLITNKVNIWREITADGVGWVSDDTTPAIERMLVEWYGTEPPIMQQMGMRAKAAFLNRFHIDGVVSALEKTLEEELGI